MEPVEVSPDTVQDETHSRTGTLGFFGTQSQKQRLDVAKLKATVDRVSKYRLQSLFMFGFHIGIDSIKRLHLQVENRKLRFVMPVRPFKRRGVVDPDRWMVDYYDSQKKRRRVVYTGTRAAAEAHATDMQKRYTRWPLINPTISRILPEYLTF